MAKFLVISLSKSFHRNGNLSVEERQLCYLRYQSCFSKSINFSKKISYCFYSQEANSVYKVTKLSRNMFKNMVLYGRLPGCI